MGSFNDANAFVYIFYLFYLWADLVATLSNLQMYNFTHDGRATVRRTAGGLW